MTDPNSSLICANFDNLVSQINVFIGSAESSKVIKIKSSLRKPIRKLTDFLSSPIFYFAYGLGKEYTLYLSKMKFQIEFYRLTHRTKKLFITYTDLKITEDINQEQIALLDPYLGLTKWFELLSDCLLELGGEKEFSSKHYDLEKKIWANLKANPNLRKWLEIEVRPVVFKYPQRPIKFLTSSTKSSNIYCHQNHLSYFISIDMTKANFQVLKQSNIIKFDSWADFLSQYHVRPYFAQLKKLRLKVLTFPELNPLKQKICWENTMLGILDQIIQTGVMTETDFAVWNGDEIIFHADPNSITTKLQSLTKFLAETFGDIQLKIQAFQLIMLNQEKKWFVRRDTDTNKITFKCVCAEMMPDAVAAWIDYEKSHS